MVDKEEIKLLKLQADFESGLVSEENISLNDTYKLQQLYSNQIIELKAKIKKYKEEVSNIIEEIKQYNK